MLSPHLLYQFLPEQQSYLDLLIFGENSFEFMRYSSMSATVSNSFSLILFATVTLMYLAYFGISRNTLTRGRFNQTWLSISRNSLNILSSLFFYNLQGKGGGCLAISVFSKEVTSLSLFATGLEINSPLGVTFSFFFFGTSSNSLSFLQVTTLI